jgi:putative intracellular protease/amidase
MPAHIIMKILIVLTSHSELGDTGKKTGFWVEEFEAPYYELADAGAEITLASPKGGQPPIDPSSQLAAAQTKFTHRFDQDEPLKQKLVHTLKLSDVKAADFGAVFYPGGHGPMWDLVKDTNSIALLEAFQQQGKPMALVCHAPCALLNVKLANREGICRTCFWIPTCRASSANTKEICDKWCARRQNQGCQPQGLWLR